MRLLSHLQVKHTKLGLSSTSNGPFQSLCHRMPYSGISWTVLQCNRIADAHIREGLVVRPLQERTDPKIGRVLLKYVSDSYLFGEKTDHINQ